MTAAIHVRLKSYLATIFRRGLRSYSLDFDTLARRLNVSRRTVERGVATIRTAEQFIFRTIRVGRSYVVQVSDRHPSIRGVLSPTGIKTETLRPAGISAFKPRSRKIAALAAVVARTDLAGQHWDNCKVQFRFPHAFLFAFRALSEGHALKAIVHAYDLAVHQRHKDATDYDLNHGAHLTKWQPSSTVTLAEEILRRDTRTSDVRWAEFLGIGLDLPEGWQPI